MANSTLTISPSVIASAYASTPAAAVHHVYDRCYVDFAPVDFRWQISRSCYTQKFDSYRECLTNIGVEPGKDADTILAQLDERGLDARKCVEEGTPNG